MSVIDVLKLQLDDFFERSNHTSFVTNEGKKKQKLS